MSPRSQRGAPATADSHSRRLLKATLVVVGLQLTYVFFFVYPGHALHSNGLNLGVVGTAQQSAVARQQLKAALPSADVDVQASPEQALKAIRHRDIYGALVFQPRGEELLTASAASFTVSSLLNQAAARAGVRQVHDVVPLASGDRRGVAFNLLVIPLVVTGLLGAQLAIPIVGPMRLRRRLWTIASIAAVAALAVVALIGPILGALPGPFLPEVGVLALAMFGLLSIGGSMVRLLGPAGLGASFTVFLMLGSPASGAASAPQLLPIPWSQLGGYLTPGALTSALRSVAYFDRAHLAQPLAVLAVLAVVGIGLEALADRASSRRSERSAPASANSEAAALAR